MASEESEAIFFCNETLKNPLGLLSRGTFLTWKMEIKNRYNSVYDSIWGILSILFNRYLFNNYFLDVEID